VKYLQDDFLAIQNRNRDKINDIIQTLKDTDDIIKDIESKFQGLELEVKDHFSISNAKFMNLEQEIK